MNTFRRWLGIDIPHRPLRKARPSVRLGLERLEDRTVPSSITSLAPNFGPTSGATGVIVNGSGFTGATAVTFGTTAAMGYYVMSDTMIEAYSPAEPAGVVDVVVTAPSGPSARSSADQFTYQGVQASTSTSLSSSADPSSAGQSVTFTATVNGSGGTPTGVLTFQDGATVLGTKTLSASGQATFTSSGLAAGSHSITAVYGGDAAFAGSTSYPLSQMVNTSQGPTITNPGNQSSAEGARVNLPVQASAPDGALLTFGAAGLPPGLSIDSSSGVITGAITGMGGNYAVTVTASDGAGQASQGFEWDVVPPPVSASPDVYSVLASGTTAVSAANGVLANDYGGEAPLQAWLSALPAHGSLVLQTDGSFSYTPGANFGGRDQFTYVASDGVQASSPTTVILVGGPLAVDDAYTIHHDTSLTLDTASGVLANDSTADGSPLTAACVTGPRNGTLTLNADGSLVYLPNPGFVGDDSFTYVAQTLTQTSDPATVTISVTDQAPDAPDDTFQVHAGTTLTANSPGLTEVATDPDLDVLSFNLVTGPQHGTMNLKPDGTFTYQPQPGFVGTDTFTYRTSDGALSSPTDGTVTITVEDLKPTAAPASFDLAADGSLSTDTDQSLLNASFQPEDNPLTAVLISDPQHAAAEGDAFTLNPDGTFDYAPQNDFVGADSFSYAVTDGTLTSDPVTVTLNVTNTLLPHNDYYVLGADGSLTVDAAHGVLANDFSPSGGALQVDLSSGDAPALDGLVMNADGSFTFHEDPSQPPPQGSITFTYQDVAAGVGAGAGGPLQGLVTLYVASQTPTVHLKEADLVNARPVILDEGTTSPSEWPVTTGQAEADLGPSWSTVAYAKGLQVKVNAVFNIDKPDAYSNTNAIWVVGLTNADGVAPIVGKAVVSGNTLVVKDMTLYLPDQVEKLSNFQITWRVIPPGGTINLSVPTFNEWGQWSPVGTSSYVLYLTFQTPVGTKLYRTVLDVGTNAATGKATQDDVVQAVMDKFDTLNIQQPAWYAVGGTRTLKYYQDWDAASKQNLRTTVDLLRTGQGNCQAWTKFFLDVLMAQGIMFDKPGEDVYLKNPLDNVMYVKNWQAPAAPNTDAAAQKAGYLYLNTSASVDGEPWKYDAATKSWSYDWTVETVKKGNGLAGQGNANPVADFPNHEVAQITFTDGSTVLFDPSYGKEYQGATDADRLLALQKGAIDFFGRSFPDPASKTWYMLFRPASQQSLQLISKTKAYGGTK